MGLRRACFLWTLALPALVTAGGQTQTAFTNASLKGIYSFDFYAAGNSQVAGLGLLAADGNGGVAGAEWDVASSREPLARSFAGTYVVNADGTGAIDITYSGESGELPGARRYSFVLVDGNKQLRAVRTDNGVVGSASFVLRQPSGSPTTFTNASLRGTYGFNISGTANGRLLAGFGLLTADGNGGVTGTEVLLSGGSASTMREFRGSYIVNPEGSGVLDIVYAGARESARYGFVFVGDGNREIRALRLDPGAAVTASFLDRSHRSDPKR